MVQMVEKINFFFFDRYLWQGTEYAFDKKVSLGAESIEMRVSKIKPGTLGSRGPGIR